jgi:hypothetical protein
MPVPQPANAAAQAVLAGVFAQTGARSRQHPLFSRGAVAASQALNAMARQLRLALGEELDSIDDLVDPTRGREAEREAAIFALDDAPPLPPSPGAQAFMPAAPQAQAKPARQRRQPAKSEARRVQPVRRAPSQQKQRRKTSRAWRIVAWGLSLLAVIAMAASFWLVATQWNIAGGQDDGSQEPRRDCRAGSPDCRR